MGVYIKGMEMPTSCWDCYFQDCGNCRLNANKVVDKCIIEDRRDEDCPLVPVPPHGRLIDADALDINRREERAWIEIKDAPFSEYLEGVKDGLHEAAKCVSTAPTIIPPKEGT